MVIEIPQHSTIKKIFFMGEKKNLWKTFLQRLKNFPTKQ
jgi:hypothetical protein